MENQKIDIDLVYLWVDGNDSVWLKKRNKFLGIELSESETNCKGRYISNDELKYSLRSIEKHLPWIRKIFIVTDNQIPEWLNMTHPKIKIINQNDIIPRKALPCYNSVVIEYFLYRIPDLSEFFLYANDDMFVNANLSPAFFFADDGYPIIRLHNEFFSKTTNRLKEFLNKPQNIYRLTIDNASFLIKKNFGKSYSGLPHHNIDAYRKSDYKKLVENVFEKEISSITTNHTRKPNDIQRIIFLYYALAIEHGHQKHVNRKESCRIRVQKADYMYFITQYHPKLFCLNDGQHVSDQDRERIKPFLETIFPDKSQFEK